jgi:hypothetical protein
MMVSRKCLNITLYVPTSTVVLHFHFIRYSVRETRTCSQPWIMYRNFMVLQFFLGHLLFICLNPGDALRKSIILHLLHSHFLCGIKSFLSRQAYQHPFSRFVTKSLRLNREEEKHTSWYSGDFRFEFRRQDRETSPGFSYFFPNPSKRKH